MELKFPQKGRNKKLTDEQIRELNLQYTLGESRINLAVKFGVSYSTVLYWTNEEHRQKCIKQAAETFKWKYKNDEMFRRKVLQLINASNRKRYHTEPKFKRYYKQKGRVKWN